MGIIIQSYKTIDRKNGLGLFSDLYMACKSLQHILKMLPLKGIIVGLRLKKDYEIICIQDINRLYISVRLEF